MSMSNRDYAVLAEVIGRHLGVYAASSTSPAIRGAKMAAVDELSEDLIRRLVREHPRFDSGRFRDAIQLARDSVR